MSEKYNKIIKTSSKKAKQMRLIIKNGIRYNMILETDIKPKYKKIKPFNTKRWIIKNVKLVALNIMDKKEIERIIEADKKQQESYDKAFQMNIGSEFCLMLSNAQYESLTRFLDKNDIKIGQEITLIRKGLGFNTRLSFGYTLTNPNKK